MNCDASGMLSMVTYTNEDALALQVDVTDRELVGERHYGSVFVVLW
jgi:hypothetical protein